MENRTDRRVLRSRRLIVAAFERLLETRPYERIGVSAIAQEADIDRKTFYQHYRSVDGLLGAIADDFAAGLLDEVEQAAPADPCPGERERALSAFLEALVRAVTSGLERDRRYMQRVPADVLYGHLSRAFKRQVGERRLLEGVLPERERAGSLAFALGGIFSLLQNLLADEPARPAAEVERMAVTLTESGLLGMLDA
ncbi:TetR/AcrR family transcriptional regulator [uncultured Enorma sp.]|uniref:TetR/AcrR family transcriptional regulator n=1 Tax=uncultured Enorma sp. TaxID=1714346 RepID=UPI002594B79D|nr:TetR/AcrR family transcriptional regulator [uncultured Enorma sp.]